MELPCDRGQRAANRVGIGDLQPGIVGGTRAAPIGTQGPSSENIARFGFCRSYRALYILNWIYRFMTEKNYRQYLGECTVIRGRYTQVMVGVCAI
jgi:hypothetical protein